MKNLPAKVEKVYRRRKGCASHLGRRMIRTVLLALALALVAWPAWNFVAAPLLTLATLTYWQMSAIVFLLGVVTRLFSTADSYRHRSPSGIPAADFAWSRCRRATNTHQG